MTCVTNTSSTPISPKHATTQNNNPDTKGSLHALAKLHSGRKRKDSSRPSLSSKHQVVIHTIQPDEPLTEEDKQVLARAEIKGEILAQWLNVIEEIEIQSSKKCDNKQSEIINWLNHDMACPKAVLKYARLGFTTPQTAQQFHQWALEQKLPIHSRADQAIKWFCILKKFFTNSPLRRQLASVNYWINEANLNCDPKASLDLRIDFAIKQIIKVRQNDRNTVDTNNLE